MYEWIEVVSEPSKIQEIVNETVSNKITHLELQKASEHSAKYSIMLVVA